ncbi:MAG: RibD family protein [Pseudomonadota bacterium]
MTDPDTDNAWWMRLLQARRAADRGHTLPTLDSRHDLVALFGDLAAVPCAKRYVLAHLGQSLDGRIATEDGHSHYIGCQESIVHLHRLRALVDAVVIGVGTATADQPRLTVRHVAGENPTRVVIDPSGRLPTGASLLTDRAAPTVVVTAETTCSSVPSHVATVTVPKSGRTLDPRTIVDALAARGLTRLLIEGGGQTVSAFVAADVVDRLQFAVAPLLIGSGRPALSLSPIPTLDRAMRPPCRRFGLGVDTLFDLDLRAESEPPQPATDQPRPKPM